MFRFTILRESRGRDRISPVLENEILAKIHGRKDVFEHKLAVHKMYSSVQISTVEHAHTHDTTTQIRRALRAKMNNELESHDTHSSQAHEWMNRFAFSSPPPPRPPCPLPDPSLSTASMYVCIDKLYVCIDTSMYVSASWTPADEIWRATCLFLLPSRTRRVQGPQFPPAELVRCKCPPPQLFVCFTCVLPQPLGPSPSAPAPRPRSVDDLADDQLPQPMASHLSR